MACPPSPSPLLKILFIDLATFGESCMKASMLLGKHSVHSFVTPPPKKTIFFKEIFLVDQKPFFSSPQRTDYSEEPSQMAAHLRTDSPLQAGEIAGLNADSRINTMVSLTMSHNYSLPTSPLYPQPMSHHYSQLTSHHNSLTNEPPQLPAHETSLLPVEPPLLPIEPPLLHNNEPPLLPY
jgi:hypothetical protein